MDFSIFSMWNFFGYFLTLNQPPFVCRVPAECAYWRRAGSCLHSCIASSFLILRHYPLPVLPAAVINASTFATPLSEPLNPTAENYPHYQLLLCAFWGSFVWPLCQKQSILLVVKMLKHRLMLQWGMFSRNSVG